MKKFELEVTEENILKTLERDVLNRSKDIYNFTNILENIDGNISIALDGAWGSGKTFFVKQLQILFDFYCQKFADSPINQRTEKIIANNEYLNQISITKSYKTVYYNAWLYDDHINPIMSLISSIINDTGLSHMAKKDSNIENNLKLLAKSILSFTKLPSGIGNIVDINNSNSIIDDILMIENVKDILSKIFNEIIVEQSDKLIVFIDELDRCNPSYAVSLLEKTKHFFKDDRVIFVYSTNKAQLVHTINRHYGNNFDASGYLNKFFDLSLKLSDVDIANYIESLNSIQNDSYYFNELVFDLSKYYNFSMRDCNRYIQVMSQFEKRLQNVGQSAFMNDMLLVLLIPIVYALRIVDANKSSLFEKGQGTEELEILMSSLPYFMDSVKAALRNLFNKTHEYTNEEVKDKFISIYIELFKDTDSGTLMREKRALKSMIGILPQF